MPHGMNDDEYQILLVTMGRSLLNRPVLLQTPTINVATYVSLRASLAVRLCASARTVQRSARFSSSSINEINGLSIDERKPMFHDVELNISFIFAARRSDDSNSGICYRIRVGRTGWRKRFWIQPNNAKTERGGPYGNMCQWGSNRNQ